VLWLKYKLGVVNYNISLTRSSVPEDGQKIARNMLSWLEYQ